MALYHATSLKHSDMGHTCVTMGSHSVTCHPYMNHTSAFTPQTQGVTTLWLVHIVPTHKGWPG